MERDTRTSPRTPEPRNEILDRDPSDTGTDSTPLFFSPRFFCDDHIVGQNDPDPEDLMNMQGRSTLSPDGAS